jgi:hypothetical protein
MLFQAINIEDPEIMLLADPPQADKFRACPEFISGMTNQKGKFRKAFNPEIKELKAVVVL